ncbi:MAG TPA: DUF6687 family protein [Pyrinomonadaceae bacterium]|nr:DUF6687 family protein [Pyrinomonadaceae bacterium]
MRFEFYSDAIAAEPKLSVDGTVDNAIHFSHWKGNETPASVKADTSTEIALNVVAAANRDQLTQGIDLVTNNHFDTDGVLSIWSMLNGERALESRAKLISAAEAGDFCELSTTDGVRASIVIQGSDSPTDKSGSPLARQLAGEDIIDEERAYELVLPYVERVITDTNAFEELWRESWTRIEAALDSFAKGASRVEEDTNARLSVVTLAPEVFGANGFEPDQHSAPFTAISHHACGELFLIATPLGDGWAYRIDYPYYSWAETVVRPAVARRDFSSLVRQFNDLDKSTTGQWQSDDSELASAIKFRDQTGRLAASKLTPDTVRHHVRAELVEVSTAAAS